MSLAEVLRPASTPSMDGRLSQSPAHQVAPGGLLPIQARPNAPPATEARQRSSSTTRSSSLSDINMVARQSVAVAVEEEVDELDEEPDEPLANALFRPADTKSPSPAPQAGPSQTRSQPFIIDLTATSPELSRSSLAIDRGEGGSRRTGRRAAQDSDDIIFTGSREPEISFTGVSRPGHIAGHGASRSGSAVGEGSSNGARRQRRHNFIDDLSDDVYAGAFSHDLRPVPPGAEAGPSNNHLVIRDSPPLRVRANPGPLPGPLPPRNNANEGANRLGGGGLFRGGRFTGLIAQGVDHIQNLGHNMWNAARDGWGGGGRGDQRVIVGWQGEGRRGGRRGRRPYDEDLELAAAILGSDEGEGVLDYDYPALIAAIYPTMHDRRNQLEGLMGMADGAGPPAEEPVYRTKDSHPHRLAPGFARDIIPPDREVLTLDPETQTLRAEREDLRPVCASCDDELILGMEGSSGRRPWILACGHVIDGKCLEEATARAKAQKSASKTSPRRGGRGRGGRGRGRGRGAGPVRNDPAEARHDRAQARQARNFGVGAAAEEPGREAPINVTSSPEREHPVGWKGKGKVIDLDEEEVVDGAKIVSGRAQANAVLRSWWTKCPVDSCDGEGGDLLARKGTKNAPWEMFV